MPFISVDYLNAFKLKMKNLRTCPNVDIRDELYNKSEILISSYFIFHYYFVSLFFISHYQENAEDELYKLFKTRNSKLCYLE